MQRFFVKSSNVSGDKLIISERDQLHHLKDVLRIKIGEEVAAVDDKGQEYFCKVEGLTDREVLLKITERKAAKMHKVKLTIACAIPKKSKFDDIVDRLTQLGVDRIIPLETYRVIVRLDKAKKISRQKRWEKIALSASQQSQRNSLPVIDPVKDMRQALTGIEKFDLKLIPHLIGERKHIKNVIAQAKNILVFIGPEGDFTEEEVDLAAKAGCIPVSLGDTVLRVETAAVAVASFIRLYT